MFFKSCIAALTIHVKSPSTFYLSKCVPGSVITAKQYHPKSSSSYQLGIFYQGSSTVFPLEPFYIFSLDTGLYHSRRETWHKIQLEAAHTGLLGVAMPHRIRPVRRSSLQPGGSSTLRWPPYTPPSWRHSSVSSSLHISPAVSS